MNSESLSHLVPKISELVPNDFKALDSLPEINNERKFWKQVRCPYRICKAFVGGSCKRFLGNSTECLAKLTLRGFPAGRSGEVSVFLIVILPVFYIIVLSDAGYLT